MTCDELLEHSYFDHFRDWFQPELEVCVCVCVCVEGGSVCGGRGGVGEGGVASFPQSWPCLKNSDSYGVGPGNKAGGSV